MTEWPELIWQKLDEDRVPPTQYYFREGAGTLIAYSKDHTYVWDEAAEAWVKVSPPAAMKPKQEAE